MNGYCGIMRCVRFILRKYLRPMDSSKDLSSLRDVDMAYFETQFNELSPRINRSIKKIYRWRASGALSRNMISGTRRVHTNRLTLQVCGLTNEEEQLSGSLVEKRIKRNYLHNFRERDGANSPPCDISRLAWFFQTAKTLLYVTSRFKKAWFKLISHSSSVLERSEDPTFTNVTFFGAFDRDWGTVQDSE